eukprot:TRINITY_DN14929_c0_g1_i2.p1 TRINITY_DN14929_c0_g1~~TRINITY_DN14929_c0_g1_i2.p1  ORF type:complete len:327 (+),score=36.47 TRINITY_DN14929_c0_g1_i2:437-1417(+)
MPLPRVPFLTVGRWRFRDTLVKTPEGFEAPVLRFRNDNTGVSVTLLPVHLAAAPHFFREIEAMGNTCQGVMQVGATRSSLDTPAPNSWNDIPGNDTETVTPDRWYTPAARLHGIDTSDGRLVTDIFAALGGHHVPNVRAMKNATNMRDVIRNEGYSTVLAPVWASHFPTHAKFLIDSGYKLESESTISVLRTSEASLHPAIARSRGVLSMLIINCLSNDFFPMLVILGIFVLLPRGNRQEEPYPGQGYPPAGQPYGYPPQGYPPPQYPPNGQYGGDYQPANAYPPPPGYAPYGQPPQGMYQQPQGGAYQQGYVPSTPPMPPQGSGM